MQAADHFGICRVISASALRRLILVRSAAMLDDLLSTLIDLFWWPYEAWKHTTESSRVGVSPAEKSTLRFWYAVAMTATVVIASIVLLGALAWYWIGG